VVICGTEIYAFLNCSNDAPVVACEKVHAYCELKRGVRIELTLAGYGLEFKGSSSS